MNKTKIYILGDGSFVFGDYPISSQATAKSLDFARAWLAVKHECFCAFLNKELK